MKRSKILSLILLSLCMFPSICAWADGKPTPALEADIRRLIKLQGFVNASMQAVNSTINILKPSMPKASEQFWDEFRREIDPDELAKRAIPIYASKLTHDDVRALLRFYETPAGKRLTQVMPAITLELSQASQLWGLNLVNKAREKFEAQQAKRP